MTAARLHNFNPGPAVLPLEVLEEARENLLSYRGSGIGVMEMSHRGKDFERIIAECEADIRTLLEIPESYDVLFTTGGATMQFSMVPMSFLAKGSEANIVLTGVWSEAAAKEAEKFGTVHIAASSKNDGYRFIPREVSLSNNPAYLHYTSNNTVVGSQFQTEPSAGSVPLFCDASSDILSRRIDITKYSLLYAGAQKNLGAAGVTLVVMKKELLERAPGTLPIMLDYRTYAKNRSLYNTPPTFPIYILGLMMKWAIRLGGIDALERANREKAALVYGALDRHELYRPFVERQSRSLMNLTFQLSDKALEDRFIAEAEKAGLIGLRGHRLLGGMRASLYNACPAESAAALARFLDEFAARGA